MKTFLKIFSMLFISTTLAQTTIKGTVNDDSGQPIPGANIIVIGTTQGTISDFDGNFTLQTDATPPFKLQASSVGFETSTADFSGSGSVNFTLKEGSVLDEIVVSASRTPERLFESPVTIERMGINEIKNTASAEFYDGLENLKGVDVNVNSLTFKSINTRGFATFANTRFLQLVDGMDNSTPALNFPIGNLVGLIEPDVQSVEMIAGASSALYGAGAFNGILFMNSKSPFDFQGISGYYKQGSTSQEAAGNNEYKDYAIRAAHKFSNKFAAKVNFGYLKGTDWMANNLTSRAGGATRAATDYDGINVYGDERALNMKSTAETLVAGGILPPGTDLLVPDGVNVTRTGYNEMDLTNYNAQSVKADWGLFFRPFENDFEISYQGKFGTGNTVYQGANRYNIRNFYQRQHKLEIKNNNFFLRGYQNSDDAGDSYDMYMTGVLLNEAWKGTGQWIAEYIGAYAQSILAGGSDQQSHVVARGVADTGRLEKGNPAFQPTLDAIASNPNFGQGSGFKDKSKYTHFDGNYNFSHLTDFADIQIGASHRIWELNSSGTIFTDSDGPIEYKDIGLYTQIKKSFLEEDRLNVTASLRYDDSDVFDANISPRLSLGYTLGNTKNHNIRGSFQTGFRSPTTQDLYIGLDVGAALLVGGAPDNPSRISRTYDLSATGQAITGQTQLTATGDLAYNNSFFASSVGAFAATGDASQLKIANSDYVKPEQVKSFEVGYRGKLNKLNIDFSAYYNSYEDFISTETVLAPLYGSVLLNDASAATGGVPLAIVAIGNGDTQAYRTYTNSDKTVNSYGASIGLNTKILNGFDLNANYTYAYLDFDRELNPDLATNFNTPEHKVKLGFGKNELFKNFGFNVAWRWSDTYLWEASFGDGVIPAYHTLDAMVNYRIPKLKSTIKLGGTNLIGDEYFTAFGTGYIGSMYYVSLTIN